MKFKLKQKWSRFLWTAVIGMGVMGIGTAAFKQVPSKTAFFPAQPTAQRAEPLPSELRQVKSFRSPTCGCCAEWVKHMRNEGFQVQDNIVEKIEEIKQENNIPEELASCHTAIANGYVIEGHIPAADVKRLLIEKPNVVGIAVPGMPIGSPGMESGNVREPYTVFSFNQVGQMTAFEEHSS